VRGVVAPRPAVLVTAGLVGGSFCLAGRYLSSVGGLLGSVGGFLRRLDLPLGRFGSATSVFGGGPGLICPPQGPVDLRFVRPLLRHLGGFLGQIGGLFRRVGGLFQSFGALPGPFGAVARLVGEAPGLIGRLLGIELSVVEPGVVEIGVVEIGVIGIGFPGRSGGRLVTVRARVVHGGTVVLFLDGAPGHAIGLAGLGHALAGSGLPGPVLSHDHFFPTGLPASARHGERS
jgi:hypothetical protein